MRARSPCATVASWLPFGSSAMPAAFSGPICSPARTADGCIVCVSGYRLAPFGICARVSPDGGRRWGSEIVLRDDVGSWDLGYPRVIEVEPGRLLAVTYFNRGDDPIQLNGGVRHVARTIFV